MSTSTRPMQRADVARRDDGTALRLLGVVTHHCGGTVVGDSLGFCCEGCERQWKRATLERFTDAELALRFKVALLSEPTEPSSRLWWVTVGPHRFLTLLWAGTNPDALAPEVQVEAFRC